MNNPPSAGKLSANRRNALKSTGPKTTAGKAASRRNALRLGVFAQSLLVRSLHFKESAVQFNEFECQFHDHFAPAGPLEEMLVSQIVQAAWRLRRVRQAEAGEIALTMDTNHSQRQSFNALRQLLDQTPVLSVFGEPLESKLRGSRLGCRFLASCLETLRASVEREGDLTKAAVENFQAALRDHSGPLVADLKKFLDAPSPHAENSKPDARPAGRQEQVLKFLDGEIRALEIQADANERQERAEEKSRQSAALMPQKETADRILHYESVLGRHLYRAMYQLERLQRRRLEQNIAPPVSLDISGDHEKCAS